VRDAWFDGWKCFACKKKACGVMEEVRRVGKVLWASVHARGKNVTCGKHRPGGCFYLGQNRTGTRSCLLLSCCHIDVLCSCFTVRFYSCAWSI